MKNSFKFLLALLILFPSTGAASAQTGIQVLNNEVSSQFPDGIQFLLSVSSDIEIESIHLVYGTDGRTCQSRSARQPIELKPSSWLEVEWDWEWIRSGILPPGVEVWWQWEIEDQNGTIFTTPRKTIQVQDQRKEWKSISQDGVILQ